MNLKLSTIVWRMTWSVRMMDHKQKTEVLAADVYADHTAESRIG